MKDDNDDDDDGFEIVNNCFVAGSTITATVSSRTRTTVSGLGTSTGTCVATGSKPAASAVAPTQKRSMTSQRTGSSVILRGSTVWTMWPWQSTNLHNLCLLIKRHD